MNLFSIFLLWACISATEGRRRQRRRRGSKKLLTKEVPMQRAEMTAFANASGALSTDIS